MSPPPTPDAYRLSPETSQHIFTTQILPADLPPSVPPSPSTPPLALLTVGQTGAGKSLLSGPLLAALRAGPRRPAHLVADAYKARHPAYPALLRDQPRLASSAAGPDARRWLEMAVAAAAERRADVLLESACRHPRDFAQLARILRGAAYRVVVLVLAVPAGLSRLGALVRYVDRRPEAAPGAIPPRLTPRTVHDDSYAGLSAAAEFLDEEQLADQVLVVRRGGLVAHGETRGAGAGGVAAAVAEERERPLTGEERAQALRDLKLVEGSEEVAAQIDEIRELLGPLMWDGAAGPREPLAEHVAAFPALAPLVYGDVPKSDEPPEGHVLYLGIL